MAEISKETKSGKSNFQELHKLENMPPCTLWLTFDTVKKQHLIPLQDNAPGVQGARMVSDVM
jgi:hypothetical protein